MVIISVFFRVPIQLIIFALIAFVTVSIMMSDMAFKKDYKFLDLNWGSTAQLSNRDGNNIKRMLILIGGIVVVIIITAIIYSVASVILAKTGIVVSLAITLALMVTSFLYHRSSLKFWKSEL